MTCYTNDIKLRKCGCETAAIGVFVGKAGWQAYKHVWSKQCSTLERIRTLMSHLENVASLKDEAHQPLIFQTQGSRPLYSAPIASLTQLRDTRWKKVKTWYGVFMSPLFFEFKCNRTEVYYTCNKNDLWTHQESVQMN